MGRLCRLSIWLIAAVCVTQARADTSLNTSYTFEITPHFGIDLPYDLWGTPGTLKTIGLRFAYNLAGAGGAGALETAAIVQHADPDRAYTFDLGYRYDFVQEGLNAFFSIGFHNSYFKLVADRKADGSCVVPNSAGTACLTDTGNYVGLFVGGGIMFPLAPSIPLKFAMRFYSKPQLWLLLEMGLGFRF